LHSGAGQVWVTISFDMVFSPFHLAVIGERYHVFLYSGYPDCLEPYLTKLSNIAL
jgi:hypothetical protein